VQSWRLYSGFFTDAQPQQEYHGLHSLSWFFHQRERAIAEQLNKRDAVYYVPVDILNYPLRSMTLHNYPRITTFATYFPKNSSLTLPPGRWLVSWRGVGPRLYAAFMPDGTIVYLPWTENIEIDHLHAGLKSSLTLTDPYGALAATVVETKEPLELPMLVAHKVDVNFSDRIKLIGWNGPRDITARSFHVLYFQRGELAVSVQMIKQLWNLDAERVTPGSQMLLGGFIFAPEDWQPDDIYPVGIYLAAAEGADPGVYQLIVSMIQAEGQHRLSVVAPDGRPGDDFAIVAKFKVPLPPPDISGMQPVQANFGEQIELIGYRFLDSSGMPVTRPQPGKPINLTLFWRALQQPEDDFTVLVHVEDQGHQIVAQADAQPQNGIYPTSVWDVDEIVTSTHVLVLPDKPPYTILVGLYRWPTLERLVLYELGVPIQTDRYVITELP
jgi:hypothetical protein